MTGRAGWSGPKGGQTPTTPPQDLSYLNRDLSKVILVDTNPEHVALNPENAIVVPAWDGRPGDKGLVDLIPFLECTSAVRRVTLTLS